MTRVHVAALATYPITRPPIAQHRLYHLALSCRRVVASRHATRNIHNHAGYHARPSSQEVRLLSVAKLQRPVRLPRSSALAKGILLFFVDDSDAESTVSSSFVRNAPAYMTLPLPPKRRVYPFGRMSTLAARLNSCTPREALEALAEDADKQRPFPCFINCRACFECTLSCKTNKARCRQRNADRPLWNSGRSTLVFALAVRHCFGDAASVR